MQQLEPPRELLSTAVHKSCHSTNGSSHKLESPGLQHPVFRGHSVASDPFSRISNGYRVDPLAVKVRRQLTLAIPGSEPPVILNDRSRASQGNGAAQSLSRARLLNSTAYAASRPPLDSPAGCHCCAPTVALQPVSQRKRPGHIRAPIQPRSARTAAAMPQNRTPRHRCGCRGWGRSLVRPAAGRAGESAPGETLDFT